MTNQIAYSVPQLAAAVGKSEKYIRNCIHADGNGPLIPLKAKKDGKGYLVLRSDVDAWLNAHEDA